MTVPPGETHHFEPIPASVAAARRFAVSVLRQHGFPSWPADLLVSEVATNVIAHARTPFTVSVDIDEVARVVVSDGAAILPAVRDLAADSEDGRGLFLVEALAHRWGVERAEGGKQVWFEVTREERQPGDD